MSRAVVSWPDGFLSLALHHVFGCEVPDDLKLLPEWGIDATARLSTVTVDSLVRLGSMKFRGDKGHESCKVQLYACTICQRILIGSLVRGITKVPKLEEPIHQILDAAKPGIVAQKQRAREYWSGRELNSAIFDGMIKELTVHDANIDYRHRVAGVESNNRSRFCKVDRTLSCVQRTDGDPPHPYWQENYHEDEMAASSYPSLSFDDEEE